MSKTVGAITRDRHAERRRLRGRRERFAWGFTRRLATGACVLGIAASCATISPDPISPSGRLDGTDGVMHSVRPTGGTNFAVLVFFVAGCRLLEVHDRRIREVAETYGPRGVPFFGIDSDRHGSMDVDRHEASRHGYPFPILRDVGGRLARDVGAHHAGYAVVIDANATVRYRGAIDSDRFQLHENASSYLADALNDLLAGKDPRRRETPSFGCALDP